MPWKGSSGSSGQGLVPKDMGNGVHVLMWVSAFHHAVRVAPLISMCRIVYLALGLLLACQAAVKHATVQVSVRPLRAGA